jgi:hypothetical protein
MNLFALTSIPNARIIRFPLTQELQAEIQSLFDDQYNSFIAGIDTVVPFEGSYRPEEGELLAIENFVDIDGIAEAVANPLRIDQYNPEIHSLDCVKALFTEHRADGAGRILVQIFENRRLIAQRGMAIFFSGNTFQKMTDAGLALDTRLLAVLEAGTLKFQSFHFARRVFELSEYFKDATTEEVTNFANHDKFFVASIPEFVAAASAPIRKKIALIRQSGVLDNFTTDQIAAAAVDFAVHIEKTDDGKIKLPTNATELRRILRFLDEDHYKSPLSQTHYISNSKRVAD